MQYAVMSMTNGDQILWNIEGSPFRIAPVMDFCRPTLAPFNFAVSMRSCHDHAAYGAKAWMGEILTIGSIGNKSGIIFFYAHRWYGGVFRGYFAL
jgi:hypothetical protein